EGGVHLPERVLAHVALALPLDGGCEEEVEVGAVHRGDHERAARRHVLAPDHLQAQVHAGGGYQRVAHYAVEQLRRRRPGATLAPPPGGAHPNRATISSTTSSMLRSLVSTTTASSATARGAVARPWSRASRSASEVATWS